MPSWAGLAFDVDDSGLDAFRFSDEPVFEALGLARTAREDSSVKLATIRTATGTAAVRVEEDGAVELGSCGPRRVPAPPRLENRVPRAPTGAGTTSPGSTTPR